MLVSIFLDGGIDSLSVLAPTNDSTYRSLRPTLALPPGAGTPFTEDPSLRWHPAAAALDALHRAGKISVLPAVGYYEPRPVALHLAPLLGGRRRCSRSEVTGWMGRLLDVIGTPDNPLQGLSLDGSLSPALATASVPVAAIDGPSYDIWAEGVWGKPEELMFGAVARARAAARGEGRRPAGRRASPRRQAMQLKAQLEPFSGEEIAPPVAYPEGDGEWFRASLAGARGDARRRAADPLRRDLGAGRVRHPRQPGGLVRRRPRARPPTRSPPSRPTSRRAASPTA